MADYHSSLTGPEIDAALTRAKAGGEIDTLLQNKAQSEVGPTYNDLSYNADGITNSGFFICKNGVPTNDWGYIIHAHYAENRATQWFKSAFNSSAVVHITKDTLFKREKYDGVWSPWEYVNPPMALGVEYRTTERYLGKPVYTKLVDCGVGPNATRKTVSAGISNVDRAVSANGSWGNMSIPYEWFSGDASGAQAITITLNDTYIDIASTVNYSGRTIYALIKYTKTTD